MSANTRSRKGSNNAIKSPSKSDSQQTSKLLDMFQTLEAKMDKMDASFQLLRTEVAEMRGEINSMKEIKKALEFTQETVKDSQRKISELEDQTKKQYTLYAEMANKVTKINLEKRVLEEQILQLDAYIRRENLVFSGISEDIGETTERTEVKLRNVLDMKMKISNAQGMEFRRCHRIGRSQKGKSRDIIVRFLRYQDRVKIWDSRFNLKNTDIYVKEDFPVEIDKRRQLLYPIWREAKIQKKKTSLIADTCKLVIEGVRYGVDDIDKLPPDFQPKNLATRVGEKAILFYGINSPYSNFYCSIKDVFIRSCKIN